QEAELAGWSEGCPANFLHALLLVRAERARLRGDHMAAMNFYDQSMTFAAEQGFLHMEALAAELAARFWHRAGKPDFGALYLERALQSCESWGAASRVAALRERFRRHARGDARSAGTGAATQAGTHEVGDPLDLATLLKANQVLSGEILLDRLLAKLLDIILENAAGDRVVLVLQEQGGPVIQGVREGLDGEARLLMNEPLQGTKLLSEGIANYVIRTRETLVL